MPQQAHKIIISGGGTGGHIFPAISIADELKKRNPKNEILFVGAEDRMEMEKVPAAGYNIIGLPVAGFKRKLTFANITVIIKLLKSMAKARKIIRNFQPEIAIGVGGYASGPVLRAAAKHKIPTLLQEQNSYAGLTNKLLAQTAYAICTAYEKMDRFFPADRIKLTGNPVRRDLTNIQSTRKEACAFFGIPEDKKTVLILGGSLGARTVNNTILSGLDKIAGQDAVYLWQTGKLYIENAREKSGGKNEKIKAHDFIFRMDLAYTIADVIVSRAGAGTISELCVIGKPCILIPSPNVAEDHQTKNAMALVDKEAAVLVSDADAANKLFPAINELLSNKQKQDKLSENIKKLALPDAAATIADEVYNILEP